jgi:hypothetical protein
VNLQAPESAENLIRLVIRLFVTKLVLPIDYLRSRFEIKTAA